MKYNNIIIKLSIISILVIVLFGIILLVFNTKEYKTGVSVDILVAPKDSTIKINDVVVKSPNIKLAPGLYKYHISRNHFNSIEGEIRLLDNDTNRKIIGLLSPSDSEGQKIHDDNQELYLSIEKQAGDIYRTDGKLFRDKNPIVNKLPYSNHLFTIGYRLDSEDKTGNSIIVTIRSKPLYYNSAVVQISNWGINPADYNIEIIGEENPFL